MNFIGLLSNDLIQVLIKTGSVKFDLKFNIYRFKIDIFSDLGRIPFSQTAYFVSYCKRLQNKGRRDYQMATK